MLEFFLFIVLIGLFFGFLILELVFFMLGGFLMGDGGDVDVLVFDVVDVDLDFDFDVDLVDFDKDFDVFEIDFVEIELEVMVGSFSVLVWFGLGNLFVVIWLVFMFLSFGVIGVGV